MYSDIARAMIANLLVFLHTAVTHTNMRYNRE